MLENLLNEHLVLRKYNFASIFFVVASIVGKDLCISCGAFASSLIIFKVATIHLSGMDNNKDMGTGAECSLLV